MKTRQSRPVECILFDSDGTLVDSEPLSFDVLAEMFRDLGVGLDTEALHLDHRGWKMGEVIELLAERHGIIVPNGFEEAFRARQLEAIDARLQAVEGVPELLASLDLPMAVVTSGPMPKVRRALAVTGLDGFFGDNIYSAYEVGVFKPDPEIYRHAATDMGFPVERCLAVEDSPIGLEAAATCGAVTVFLNRFSDPVPWRHVVEIASMSELPAVLERR